MLAWILLIGWLWQPGSVQAESVRDLVAEGNALYHSGNAGQALEAYEKAGAEAPEAAEIWFDKGDAYLRMQEYEKAREAFQRAASLTKDLGLEARSHHNLGMASFEEAGKEKNGADPKKMLSLYEQSVRHYRDALRIDPELKESAQNLEMTRLIMKDLMDQIKKQEEAAKDKQKQGDKPPEEGEQSKGDQDQGAPSDQASKEDKEGSRDDQGEKESKEARSAESQEQETQKSAASSGQGEEKQAQEASKAQKSAEKPDEKGKEQVMMGNLPEDILREEKENRLMQERARVGVHHPSDKDW
jgi:tetratricopeptide (TPR) repeat protein